MIRDILHEQCIIDTHLEYNFILFSRKKKPEKKCNKDMTK